MITISLWKDVIHLKLIKKKYLFQAADEATPSEKACYVIIHMLITPFVICFDVMLLPFELIYYVLYKKYIKQLEDENGED